MDLYDRPHQHQVVPATDFREWVGICIKKQVSAENFRSSSLDNHRKCGNRQNDEAPERKLRFVLERISWKGNRRTR